MHPKIKSSAAYKFLFEDQIDQQRDFWLTIAGHGFFLTFIIFSLVFYKERLINFDSSYFTFHLLAKEDFYVLHGRNVSYFSQTIALLAVKAGCTVKQVMMIFSFSFMLFYYLCFLVVRHVFKQVDVSIFFALALCLTFRYKFYTGISEITASLGLIALFFGWVLRRIKGKNYYLIAFLFFALINFGGHPFAFIPVFAYLGYEFLLQGQWRNRSFIYFLAACLGLLALRFLGMESGSYEDRQLGRLSEAMAVLTNLGEYEVWEIIQGYFKREYTFPVIIFLISLIWVAFKGRWKTSLYFLLWNIGLMILIIIHNSYIKGGVKFMIDGYLGFLGVLWALFFLLLFMKQYRNRFCLFLTIGLLLFGLHRIYEKHSFFEQRLTYIQEIIDDNATAEQRKFVFHKRHFSWEKMWVPNTLTYESLLLSSIEDPKNAVNIVVAFRENKIEPITKRKDSLVGIGKIEDLPKHYFQFGEEGYKEIKELPW